MRVKKESSIRTVTKGLLITLAIVVATAAVIQINSLYKANAEKQKRLEYEIKTEQVIRQRELKKQDEKSEEHKKDLEKQILDLKGQVQAKKLRLAQAAKAAQNVAVKVVPHAQAASGTKYDWMRLAGIAESDFGYVDYIVTRESGWNPNAVNKSSGACSLVQALPCSKIGPNWSDPVVALKWQYNYVKARYGGYAGAYAFWISHGWY